MPSVAMSERLVVVKRQIKEWEKQFQEKKGVPPLKRDIVDDAEIHQLYREYKQIRYGKENRSHGHNHSHKRKTPALNEQVDWSFLVSEDEEDAIDMSGSPHRFKTKVEIGPTPQASGRILSIFDFKPTPPESSPLKSGKTEVTTPSKSRIKSNVFCGDNDTPTKKIQLTTSPSKAAVDTPMYLNRSQYVHLSPEKTRVSLNIDISPVRPRAPLVFDVTPTKSTPTPTIDFSVSPSPFKAHRSLTKKLSDIFNDSKSLVSELGVLGEESQEPEQDEVDEEEEDMEENEVDTPFRVKRQKTQKRSTRRWKIKPVELEAKEDVIANSDLHKRMEMLEKQEIENIQSGMVSGNEEEDEEEEEEVDLEKELSINITVKKKKYVSQNFKRLKINDPRTRAFKRRMRR